MMHMAFQTHETHKTCVQYPVNMPDHTQPTHLAVTQARKTHVCRVAEEVSTNGVATTTTQVMDYEELTDILK